MPAKPYRMIDYVVFDLGGVLIDWNPRYLYRKLFDDPNEIEYFLTKICHGQWNESLDEGYPFAKACQDKMAEFPNYRDAIEAYWKRWPEMLNGVHQGTVDLLEQIYQSQSHRLFSITNWSAETFPTARQLFPFLGYFEDIVVSGEEKLIKPNVGIFQILFERNQLMPRKGLFIDDNAKNVDAARACGMQALHFTTSEQLKSDLDSLNILIKS